MVCDTICRWQSNIQYSTVRYNIRFQITFHSFFQVVTFTAAVVVVVGIVVVMFRHPMDQARRKENCVLVIHFLLFLPSIQILGLILFACYFMAVCAVYKSRLIYFKPNLTHSPALFWFFHQYLLFYSVQFVSKWFSVCAQCFFSFGFLAFYIKRLSLLLVFRFVMLLFSAICCFHTNNS